MTIPDNEKVFDNDRVADRTADVIDQASNVSEMMLRADLENARGKSEPEHDPDFDGTHCMVCAQVIPIQRVNLGKIRCVYCQGLIEARQNQHRR